MEVNTELVARGKKKTGHLRRPPRGVDDSIDATPLRRPDGGKISSRDILPSPEPLSRARDLPVGVPPICENQQES